jgi:FtsZ-interacting cell division protein ZipA
MGHSAILIGSVALATGLICLLCGFLWGRSNLKSQVEDAVDLVRRSAETREFDLREQLDQKMVELSILRGRAEERPRSQKQNQPLNLEQLNASAAGENAVEKLPTRRQAPIPKQEPAAPVVDATEKTIQNLLRSMEEKLKQPEDPSPVLAQERPKPAPAMPPVEKPAAVVQPRPAPAVPSYEPPRVAPSKSATPAPPRPPERQTVIASQPNARPSPPKSPAPAQRPPAKDEWQEFAASLEALRRQSK